MRSTNRSILVLKKFWSQALTFNTKLKWEHCNFVYKIVRAVCFYQSAKYISSQCIHISRTFWNKRLVHIRRIVHITRSSSNWNLTSLRLTDWVNIKYTPLVLMTVKFHIFNIIASPRCPSPQNVGLHTYICIFSQFPQYGYKMKALD